MIYRLTLIFAAAIMPSAVMAADDMNRARSQSLGVRGSLRNNEEMNRELEGPTEECVDDPNFFINNEVNNEGLRYWCKDLFNSKDPRPYSTLEICKLGVERSNKIKTENIPKVWEYCQKSCAGDITELSKEPYNCLSQRKYIYKLLSMI